MVIHESKARFGGSEEPTKRILAAVLMPHAGELTSGIKEIQIRSRPASRSVQAQVLAKGCPRRLPSDANLIDLRRVDFRKVEARRGIMHLGVVKSKRDHADALPSNLKIWRNKLSSIMAERSQV